MASATGSSSLDGLGQRLRDQRAEAGRSMSDVAREAEVSVSYLSGIESGANVPSLPVLARIVRALGLSMAEVLRSDAKHDVTVGRYDPAAPGIQTLAAPGRRLEVLGVVAEPGEEGDAPFELGTAVLVHVRSGGLRVTVGDDAHDLQVGDTLHASNPVAMGWTAVGDETCASLWVTLRP